MSMEVFLGKPPAHIEQWIRDHQNSGSSYIWKDAVYTNEWKFSDGVDHEYQIGVVTPYMTLTADGENYCSETTISDDTTLVKLTSGDKSIYAMRVYTPGHQEDSSGNWVQGSWENVSRIDQTIGSAAYIYSSDTFSEVDGKQTFVVGDEWGSPVMGMHRTTYIRVWKDDVRDAYVWVDAVYTSEWIIDHDGYDMSNGPSGWLIDGATCDQIENDGNEKVKLSGYDINDSSIRVSAYRKYTPGHWENAHGNWVQGSWSEWSNENIRRSDGEGKWQISLITSPIDAQAYPSNTDDNANLVWHDFNKVYATRTWTTTIPAPAE